HFSKIVYVDAGQISKPSDIRFIQAYVRRRSSVKRAMNAANNVHLPIVHSTVNKRCDIVLRNVTNRCPYGTPRGIRFRREDSTKLTQASGTRRGFTSGCK